MLITTSCIVYCHIFPFVTTEVEICDHFEFELSDNFFLFLWWKGILLLRRVVCFCGGPLVLQRILLTNLTADEIDAIVCSTIRVIEYFVRAAIMELVNLSVLVLYLHNLSLYSTNCIMNGEIRSCTVNYILSFFFIFQKGFLVFCGSSRTDSSNLG